MSRGVCQNDLCSVASCIPSRAVIIFFAAAAVFAQQSQPAAAPSTQSSGRAVFQPGVEIDWTRKEVRVAGQIVLRQGTLEFFACTRGKEHESIVRMGASCTHIFMALGLVGISPGHPPQWDEKSQTFGPPTGDLVELSIEWRDAGKLKSAEAFDWLIDIGTGSPPPNRPWVFAGSVVRPNNSLAADASGAAIALVDFEENLMSLSRGHVNRNDDLWVEANNKVIPAAGTAVTIVFRAAKPWRPQARIDHRGDVFVDEKLVAPADFADIVMLIRRLDPNYVQAVTVCGTLEADREGLIKGWKSVGLPDMAIAFEQCR